jgi:hypothetical protein
VTTRAAAVATLAALCGCGASSGRAGEPARATAPAPAAPAARLPSPGEGELSDTPTGGTVDADGVFWSDDAPFAVRLLEGAQYGRAVENGRTIVMAAVEGAFGTVVSFQRDDDAPLTDARLDEFVTTVIGDRFELEPLEAQVVRGAERARGARFRMTEQTVGELRIAAAGRWVVLYMVFAKPGSATEDRLPALLGSLALTERPGAPAPR